jgi:hypothetical protein
MYKKVNRSVEFITSQKLKDRISQAIVDLEFLNLSNLERTLKSLIRKKIGYPYGVCRIVLGWSFSTDRIPLRGMHI